MSLTILIAEDDAWARNVYSSILESFSDVHAELYKDGKPLLARAMQGRYDLVFTDNQMIVMDGTELVRKIREFDHSTPIYMVSNDLRARTRALDAGATDFIDKMDMLTHIPEYLAKHLKKS